MVQQERVKASTAVIEPIREREPKRVRTTPWLIGALAIVIFALLALAGFVSLQRSAAGESERIARDAVAAWDSGRATALSDVYDSAAVIVDPNGNRIVGIDAIVAAVRDRGPDFSVSQFGNLSVSPDGSFATTSYRYTGDGSGVGMSVIKIADGKIVRQWTFEPPAKAPSPA